MRLDFQQIKAITQGAETIKEENGAFWFSRFTEEELALYLARPGFDYRARGTSGIQIEFTTDATSLFLQVVTPQPPFYHRLFAYDILVDERLAGQLKNFGDNPENGFYDTSVFHTDHPCGSFPLGSGIKKVRIVFPWSMSLGLECMELTDATFAEPVKRNKKLLIYGDSITQGACSLFPSLTYAARLTQWLEADAICKAVGSECYCPDLVRAARVPEPDVLVASYGANDWYHCTREELAENCRRFWEVLCEKYPNARKFALTPIRCLGPRDPQTFGPFESVRQVIRSVTAEFPDVTVIDCTDFVSRDQADFGDLWVHPNHIGFGLFFENLKHALEPYL